MEQGKEVGLDEAAYGEPLGAPEALLLALLIHRAARSPREWPCVLETLCSAFSHCDVFKLAAAQAGEGEALPAVRLLAKNAGACASNGEGTCGRNGGDPIRAICVALAEHLAHAAQDPNDWRHAECRMHAACVLDEWQSPIIVCDSALKLLSANAAGRAAIDQGEWIAEKGGQLRIRGIRDGALQARFAAMREEGLSDRIGVELAVGWLRLRRVMRPDGKSEFCVLVLDSGADVRARAMPPEQRIGALRSLGVTRRQAELAALLVGGASLSEAARKMGITRATANDHLTALFARSGTRRQTDLVGWLSHHIAI